VRGEERPRLLQLAPLGELADRLHHAAEEHGGAAHAALDDQEHFRKSIANNRSGAQVLTSKLSAMGYQPIPTFANFLYFDAGEDAAALSKRIQNEGVIVRPLGPWGIPTAIRVTIGTPEQNQMFLAALARAAEKAGVR